MPFSLRSDRAGFYAFLGLALLVIGMGVYVLFSGNGATTESVQTSFEASDVPLLQPIARALPAVQPASAPDVPDSTFSEATPTPEPTPVPEPVETEDTGAGSGGESSGGDSGSTSESSGASSESSEAAAAPAAPAPAAGSPELGAPSLSGGSTRAVSAAGAFTYVAFATTPGAQAIFSDSTCTSQTNVTYQYLDGSAVNYPMHNPTYFGNTLALRVVGDASGDCIKVQLPTRPNGQTGYIQTANWNIGSSDWYVQLNVNAATVSVWKGESLMYETQAVMGAPNTPTPRVTAFVDEKMAGPSGAYGPWLLSLGVFSNAHNTFGGGLPKVALHGTNNPSLMGQHASNGCIRVPNEAITWIYNNVPVGTYVAIV